MTFRGATSWGLLHSTFGSRLLISPMDFSNKRVSKMSTSPCLLPNRRLIKKKTMSLDSPLKLPGWQKLDRVKWLSPLPSVPLLRQSCTPPTPSGSDHTETSLFSSTNGPMWSDGNSSTLRLSLEQESSYGKKATLPTPLKKKQLLSSTKSKRFTRESTKSSSLVPSSVVVNLKMRDLQVPLIQQLSSFTSQWADVVFKEPHLTLSAKTSQRCLRSSSKMQTRKDNSSGKHPGAYQLDPLVLWSWSIQTTRDLSCLLRLPKYSLS